MSIPNLIPHKTLYISGYIYSYYAFVFIFEFPEHISKHILQFHSFFYKFVFTHKRDLNNGTTDYSHVIIIMMIKLAVCLEIKNV